MVCGRGARRDAQLERIGKRLESTGRVTRFAGRYEYRVLPYRWEQAFAIPGGFVFVTQGMLDALEHDSDRLAFVLGHEIGHVELDHTANHVRYRSWLKKWHLPGGRLSQGLREIAALSFRPGQELEADAYAVALMREADFRSEGAVEFFEAAGGRRGKREIDSGTHRRADIVLAEAMTDYFRTHPGTRERVEQIRRLTY
jgi:Zn-dependent protease with chaperone function